MLIKKAIPIIAAGVLAGAALVAPAASASTTAGAQPNCWGAVRCLVVTPSALGDQTQPPPNEWGDG
jgi:hypothetical protein